MLMRAMLCPTVALLSKEDSDATSVGAGGVSPETVGEETSAETLAVESRATSGEGIDATESDFLCLFSSCSLM